MIFRDAIREDVAAIASLERTPEFRSFVGYWPIEQHFRNLDDPDICYIVAEDADGSISAFAILRGLLSEHKSLELKRIVVGKPSQGVGRKLLTVALARAFGPFGAHRVWLDVFESNSRARHLYAGVGFQTDGIFREAYRRDGQFHSLVLMSILDREYFTCAAGPVESGQAPASRAVGHDDTLLVQGDPNAVANYRNYQSTVERGRGLWRRDQSGPVALHAQRRF